MEINEESSSNHTRPEGSTDYNESLNVTLEDESVDNGIQWGWDLLIDAVIVVALCAAAIVTAPVSIVAAIGFGLAAVYVAWTSEHDSNVLTDTKRLITTASIATLGATRWLGMTGIIAGSGGLFLSGIMDWLSADITGLIVLGLIAMILWSEFRADDAVILTDDDEDDEPNDGQS